MRKILFIIFSLFILSGCSANVTVNILENGQVEETVILSEDRTNFDELIDINDVINNYLDIYYDMLDGYNYENVSSNNIVGFKLEKKYDNICDYFNNSIFVVNNTSNLSCKKVNNSYEIMADVNNFICSGDCLEGPLVDDVTFNIKHYKEISDNNSDEIVNGEYKWYFEGEHNKDLSLVISIDSKDTTNSGINNTLIIILIILIIMSLIVFLSTMLYKKYKKNQLEF